MKKNLLILIVIITSIHWLTAQNTVGLLSYKPAKTFDGFNLIYPHNQPNVYLLDNCGEVVNTWTDAANIRPGNTAYLRPDGTLVKTKRNAMVTDDAIWAGGGGAVIEIVDWDNNLLWSYELNNDTARLHHDIALKNNGNILAIAWELKTEAQAIAAGRDPASMAQGKLWPDHIIEIDPTTSEIVWKWHVWDHLVQDFDPTKDNFGVVEDEPGLVDINYNPNDGHPDWMHTNAIDYIEDDFRKHILLTIPDFDEIWVIDNNTTTEEAAGPQGDLIFRYGNPAVTKQGTLEDRQLFFPHDANWVDNFVDFTNPYFENIAVFNNRFGADFSQANIINPLWEMYDLAYNPENLPIDYTETFRHPEDSTLLYSTGLSSVQILPNGNTLLISGRTGYAFELTPNDEIVWEYKTPLIMGNPATQGDSLALNNNLTFRITRYPADYEAFEDKDMSGKGWIELNPDSLFCDQILPTTSVMKEYYLKVFPNPATNHVTIEWEGGLYAEVMIYDLVGRKVDSFRASGGRKYLDVSAYEAGFYFIEIEGREVEKFLVTK